VKYEIVGRKKQIQKLYEILVSNEAEFLALYGRRRVGKTYLIRQFFSAQPCVFFEVTGIKDGDLKTQLDLFTRSMEETFYPGGGVKLERPKRWLDALDLLSNHITERTGGKKIVLFFDELPWMATQRSGILQALDHFWNTHWSRNPKLKLIVCGSAASWMLEKLVYAKGGLYNRITARMHLLPFSLKETQDYLKYRRITLNESQVLEIYMTMGGIPHYLKAVSRGLSATQNVNRICFQQDGLLSDEFQNLFASLFKDSDAHLEIILTLAQHRQGLSRDELLQKVRRSTSGGTFRRRLLELETSGFIAAFTPYDHVNKGTYYRIIDEYTLFYLNWIRPMRKSLLRDSTNYWENKSQSTAWKTWAAYAFEAVCFKHIHQISNALGIVGISKEIGSWRYIPSRNSQSYGAQIDLLIDRIDGIVNICEIKHYKSQFTIDKAYSRQLEHKLQIFREQNKTTKQLFLTMVTTQGVTKNEYADKLVHSEITLKDLFRNGSPF
jgi:hypothetical protein